MKVLDNDLCNIWYQALLERASDYTGVFLLGSRRPAYFVFRFVGRESRSVKTWSSTEMLKLLWMRVFAPARYAGPLKMRTARRYSLNRRLNWCGRILKHE